jgi:hypothetical protein
MKLGKQGPERELDVNKKVKAVKYIFDTDCFVVPAMAGLLAMTLLFNILS